MNYWILKRIMAGEDPRVLGTHGARVREARKRKRLMEEAERKRKAEFDPSVYWWNK